MSQQVRCWSVGGWQGVEEGEGINTMVDTREVNFSKITFHASEVI